jgi:hypothetical protein
MNETWIWKLNGIKVTVIKEVIGKEPALLLLFHHQFHIIWPGIEPRPRL